MISFVDCLIFYFVLKTGTTKSAASNISEGEWKFELSQLI